MSYLDSLKKKMFKKIYVFALYSQYTLFPTFINFGHIKFKSTFIL